MKFLVLALLFTGAVPLDAQESPKLNDALLDKFIGDWTVERTFPSGRIAKNTVHVEWALQHQFVTLHYRDVATPPHYEAMVLIGYDAIGKRYICHWADVFGGSYSADGYAVRDEGAEALEFKFEFHDGPLTNRFAFNPEAGVWTSTIRQIEKGEWKLFCKDRFTRTTRDEGKQ